VADSVDDYDELLRTAVLLAGLTALFMAVGYLLGGSGGAVLAFFIAAPASSTPILTPRVEVINPL
jgi:hypothetical protein